MGVKIAEMGVDIVKNRCEMGVGLRNGGCEMGVGAVFSSVIATVLREVHCTSRCLLFFQESHSR